MLSRVKSIILVAILGLICPSLVIAFLRQGQDFCSKEILEPTTIQVEQTNLFLNVLMPDGCVDEIALDDYLTSVVLREMPINFEDEALKAQAVVARTYALRRQMKGGKHPGADVCTVSSCCQGYYPIEDYLDDGGSEAGVDKVRDAVLATDNLVVVYEGELIEATYFSCSGGMTEEASAVWGADIPYLQAIKSPGEERAGYYVDTISMPIMEFKERLDISGKGNPENWIEEISYTAGGGINTIRICGKEFKGTEFRKILNLRSTSLYISILGETVTITTKGYGHRVGMSQYGADAMAVNGATFAEIIAYYYAGTQIIAINDN